MKKEKYKLLSVVLMMILVLVTVIKPVDAQVQFATASDTVANITFGWNLGNTLDTYGDWIKNSMEGKPDDYEKAWGNPVTTKEMIQKVKDAGFNAIRVPVTYTDHIDDKGTIDKVWLDRVQKIVNYVVDEGMYCIINVHHDTGTKGWLKASSSSYNNTSVKFKKLWEQIADRFKNYDDKLLYEGYNEIIDDSNNWGSTNAANYTAINDLNQIFVDTVRASGGNNKYRNLIVNTYAASSSDINLSNIVLPIDTEKNRIILEVHNYDPQAFTTTTATWTTMTDQWGSDTDKEAMNEIFDRLKKFSESNGVPVIIGEFGSEDKKNESERAEHAGYFVSTAGKAGIKCFWWDDGGSFKLLDRNALRWLYPDVVAAMVTAAGNNKKDQVINGVQSFYTKTYGEDAFNIGALTSGDGGLSFSSSNINVVRIDANTGRVTLVGTGEAVITINAAETSLCKPAVKTVNIKVNKGNQVIQGVSSKYTKKISKASFQLKAMTSGDGKIKYSSSNDAIVKVNANSGKVMIKGTGIATITVTAAETNNYKKAIKKIVIRVIS